ncbi:hypothetical protein [Oecophyllibacter saccharovorans]|uniref:hypothetical protein n=1 Tax=Oecophyllibacter saccharovorans TaxID=2558360 RepID=UPI0011735A12|nr:hypothetical protein [Oecophyllibacter saccharovorans]TPW36320.1 hypothetical protein E3203_00540 [Oecophyllibacter saccharovorans]
MQRISGRTGAAALAVALLAGGCAANCDPNQTDLYTGFGCAVGGGYDQRTRGLSQQLRDSQAASASARQALDQANAEAQSAQQNLAGRQAQLRALNLRTAQLQKRLKQASAARTLSARQEAQARSELQNIRDASRMPATENIQKVQESQKRMADLLGHI